MRYSRALATLADMNTRTTLSTAPAVVAPPAGDYHLDPARCTVTFATRHLFGLGAVHGSFQLRSGQIHVADPPQDSWARVTISAASFHTGNSGRDSAVRSDRLLAADVHPDITFTSTGLDQLEGRWVLHGRLSVRGLVGPSDVDLDVTHWDGSCLSLQASAHVDRYAFGITSAKGLAARHLNLRLGVVASRAPAQHSGPKQRGIQP
jgi:polyisoprenoid-binding protein YceI